MSKREKECLQYDGYDYDGDAVITDIAVKVFQRVEQRFGNNSKPAQIKRLLKRIALRLKYIDILWPDKETMGNCGRLSGVDGKLWS